MTVYENYQTKHLEQFNLNYFKDIDISKTDVFIDTETTGLDISKDSAFLLIFGFSDHNTIYSIEVNFQTLPGIKEFLVWIEKSPNVVGHNFKFDLHMLFNAGLPYRGSNVTDTGIMARIISNVEEMSMGLKNLAANIFGDKVKEDQKEIKLIKQRILSKNTKVLNDMLKGAGLKIKHTDIAKKLHTSEIGVEILEPKVKEIYISWCNSLFYFDYNVFYSTNYLEIYNEEKDVMLKYAYSDVILTKELYEYYLPEIMQDTPTGKAHQNIYSIERKVLLPLYEQERIGWFIDKDYLMEVAPRVSALIEKKRKILKDIAGFNLAPGQHKEIIKVLKTKFFTFPTNRDGKEAIDKNVIDGLLLEANQIPERKLFLQTIKELRTYEKWYTTYILGFINKVNKTNDNIIRTQYNQFGTVTGRLSGDFQQMPKEALFDGEVEIYHPRKILKSRDENFKLFFFDYSQMELRIQADYCLKVVPQANEINLVQAYVPYKYISVYTGKEYDLVKDQKNYNSGEWFLNSNPWVETDLHGLNVITAFGKEILNDVKTYKHFRKAGKIINFASNYGSGLRGLQSSPSLREFSNDEIEKLYNAYKTNYPGVIEFGKWVKNQLILNMSVMNHFGKIFKNEDARYSYKNANYLVQGTGAYVLKSSMIKIANLLKDYQSRMIGSVHDEIMFEIHKDEMFLVPQIKFLMEDYPEFLVPLISDVEYSDTNWAEKLDWKEE